MTATRDRLIALLTEVREACLFTDDDGIGVTEEPTISSDLFARICAAVDPTPKPRAPCGGGMLNQLGPGFFVLRDKEDAAFVQPDGEEVPLRDMLRLALFTPEPLIEDLIEQCLQLKEGNREFVLYYDGGFDRSWQATVGMYGASPKAGAVVKGGRSNTPSEAVLALLGKLKEKGS